ncbi:hypothetical protein WA026_009390 [Henosepilachna vigintioctopunctata]|uniref:DUF4200 domain-containing protein n=1 Tax=Henosepilachna vigintioctopunctata TaxID=420089 RepID=A0AAW1U4G3_9CUCU
MAQKKYSIKGHENDLIPTKVGPRLIRPKFGPSKILRVDALNNPPNFNGDEGAQNIQEIYIKARKKLDKAVIVTSRRRQQLLSEGLQKLDEQWGSLEKKENQFRGVVRKFNKFVKENLIKRERFIQSTKRNQEHFRRYSGDTAKLKEKKNHLETILDQMKTEISKHSIYENFLETVITTSIEFKTVFSFVSRFKVLMATLEDTTAKFVKNKFLLLHLMVQINKDARQKSIALNEMMNRLCLLGPVLNDVVTRNIANERIICDVHQEAIKTMADVQGTLDFMNLLYQYVCSRERKAAIYSNGDYKNQMMAIRKALGHFEKVLKLCEAREY